jgi:hypothetical protein
MYLVVGRVGRWFNGGRDAVTKKNDFIGGGLFKPKSCEHSIIQRLYLHYLYDKIKSRSVGCLSNGQDKARPKI